MNQSTGDHDKRQWAQTGTKEVPFSCQKALYRVGDGTLA